MASRKRALVVCPGRGSYDRKGLGQLRERSSGAQAIVDACDAWRQACGTPTVTELDSAERYQTTKHVAGEHASILTFACSMADFAEIDRDRYDVVGVMGNSMGFYTALGASGALSLNDTIRLVDTMGSYQSGNVIGGQVLTPYVPRTGPPDSQREQAVNEVLGSLRARGITAEWSIRLGGFAVPVRMRKE